jgi:hypothetical protein
MNWLLQKHSRQDAKSPRTQMTDFKKTAAALDPPIPDAAVEKLLPVMDALEAAFRPLQQSLTPEDDVWTGVE